MTTLSNSELTIKVSPHGAELCSIVCNEKEYLWQADPAFWKRHSPVLFPIVGSVWENEYHINTEGAGLERADVILTGLEQPALRSAALILSAGQLVPEIFRLLIIN